MANKNTANTNRRCSFIGVVVADLEINAVRWKKNAANRFTGTGLSRRRVFRGLNPRAGFCDSSMLFQRNIQFSPFFSRVLSIEKCGVSVETAHAVSTSCRRSNLPGSSRHIAAAGSWASIQSASAAGDRTERAIGNVPVVSADYWIGLGTGML